MGSKQKNTKKPKKLPTLDLHGRKSDEVYDLVDKFIMNNQNKPRICIMTGKGKGVVQKLVVDYLAQSGYPWEYEKVNGKPNQGCLVIFVS